MRRASLSSQCVECQQLTSSCTEHSQKLAPWSWLVFLLCSTLELIEHRAKPHDSESIISWTSELDLFLEKLSPGM